MNLIVDTISHIKIGTPITFHNLTLFPLTDGGGSSADYLTLDEAMAKKSAHVTEVSEGGSVPAGPSKNAAWQGDRASHEGVIRSASIRPPGKTAPARARASEISGASNSHSAMNEFSWSPLRTSSLATQRRLPQSTPAPHVPRWTRSSPTNPTQST